MNLERFCAAAGIDILCSAHVTTLYADADNRVRGIAYERPDGAVELHDRDPTDLTAQRWEFYGVPGGTLIALYGYTHVAGEGGFDLGRYPAIRAWLGRVASQPGHVTIDS